MKSILLTLTAAALGVSSLLAADPVTLNLDAFTDGKGGPAPAGWVQEEGGVIHRVAKAGDIISKGEYSSMQIEWDWKVALGANSGLKYWVNQIGKGWLGIEYQMIDDERHPDAKRGDSHSTACIYDIKGTIADKPGKPAGEWNTSKIIIKDGKIQHFLNGTMVVEADTKSDDWKERIGKSKFKSAEGFAPGHGHLLLQDHGNEVWFRNIRLTTLE